jgi:PKD repeat protein
MLLGEEPRRLVFSAALGACPADETVMSNHVLSLSGIVLLILVLGGRAEAQVVINEVNTGNAVDWVEIANLGSTSVDLSGWHFLYFEDVQTPNGVAYTFPGASGSGVTVLAPDEALVLTDNAGASLPVVPTGVQILALGFNLTWNVEEAGSALLADSLGNGVDYWAHGNPNLFLCPTQAATFLNLANPAPSNATWNGVGSPEFGTINSLDLHARQSRVDTDSASDFTMLDESRATPGALNDFQSTSDLDGMPPVALIAADVQSGLAPLVVAFRNESSGDCTLQSLTWDFDASSNPGVNQASSRNAAFTFTLPAGTPPGSSVTFDVTLTLSDSCGATVGSAALPITVIAPDPIIPQGLGFADDFEGAPGLNGLTAVAMRGWDIRLPDAASRVRTVDPRNFGAVANYGDATLNSGPTAVMMDSAASTVTAREDLVLHIDGDAIFAANGSGEFRVRMWLYSNGDEVDLDDLICFQDGHTLGNAIDRQGNDRGVPGLDGFAEILLADWHTALITPLQWREVEFVIDANFFNQHPQLQPPGSGNAGDYRIVIRHCDDFGFAANDGLLVDRVRIFGPSVPGPGESGVPGLALFDLNDATNANGNGVGTASDANGPFFTTASPGAPLIFSFEGEPNQPILLISGVLNPAAASYPIGQLDIGGPLDPSNGIPTQISILADGNEPNFINSLFNTTPSGSQTIQFMTPAFPPGFVTTLQAVMFNSTSSVIRISNAVQFEVL